MRGGHGRRHGTHGKSVNFKGSIKRLFRYLKNYIPVFILIGLFSVFGALASAVGPLISGQIINGIRKSYEAASDIPNQLIEVNEVLLLNKFKVSFTDSLLILSIIYLL